MTETVWPAKKYKIFIIWLLTGKVRQPLTWAISYLRVGSDPISWSPKVLSTEPGGYFLLNKLYGTGREGLMPEQDGLKVGDMAENIQKKRREGWGEQGGTQPILVIRGLHCCAFAYLLKCTSNLKSVLWHGHSRMCAGQ